MPSSAETLMNLKMCFCLNIKTNEKWYLKMKLLQLVVFNANPFGSFWFVQTSSCFVINLKEETLLCVLSLSIPAKYYWSNVRTHKSEVNLLFYLNHFREVTDFISSNFDDVRRVNSAVKMSLCIVFLFIFCTYQNGSMITCVWFNMKTIETFYGTRC